MRLVSSVCGGGDWGPSYCVVEIDEDYAKTLLARKAAFDGLTLPSIYQLTFWDGRGVFYKSLVLDEIEPSQEPRGGDLGSGYWCVLQGDPISEDRIADTDNERCEIDGQDVMWAANFGDDRNIESDDLPWEIVEKIAAGSPLGLAVYVYEAGRDSDDEFGEEE